MRKALPFFVTLAITACSSPPEWNEMTPSPDASANRSLDGFNMVIAGSDVPQAELAPRSLAALRTLVPGVDGARLDRLTAGRFGTICGRVRTADGWRPFVVNGDGRGEVGRTDPMDFADMADPFVDRYVVACASEAELDAAAAANARNRMDAAANLTLSPQQSMPEPPPVEAPALPPRPSVTEEEQLRWRREAPSTPPAATSEPGRFRDAVRPPPGPEPR